MIQIRNNYIYIQTFPGKSTTFEQTTRSKQKKTELNQTEANTLCKKKIIKNQPNGKWIERKLRQHFAYQCCSSSTADFHRHLPRRRRSYFADTETPWTVWSRPGSADLLRYGETPLRRLCARSGGYTKVSQSLVFKRNATPSTNLARYWHSPWLLTRFISALSSLLSCIRRSWPSASSPGLGVAGFASWPSWSMVSVICCSTRNERDWFGVVLPLHTCGLLLLRGSLDWNGVVKGHSIRACWIFNGKCVIIIDKLSRYDLWTWFTLH